jgi:transcriptional regulator of acetoin/glycerol metabolism
MLWPQHSTLVSKKKGALRREYVVRALKGHGWQIHETATALGISRKNLWERMRRLHISESTARSD